MRCGGWALFRRPAIIGLALLLAGCSAVRLGYDQGPQLAHWWLDGHLDFSDEQSPRVKQALAQWFRWHRHSQLDDYAGLLARAQAQVPASVTPAQLCAWGDELRQRLDPALEQALPLMADLVPLLTPAQVVQMEKRQARSNEEYRKNYLQADPQERLTAAVSRAVERAESLYGRLDDAQRELVAAAVRASSPNPQAWYAQRLARQADLLRGMRQLVDERHDRTKSLATLRQMAARMEGATRVDGRVERPPISRAGCEVAAQIHNVTTAAQRRHARDKLKGWESDLRHLAAQDRPGVQTGQAPVAATAWLR